MRSCSRCKASKSTDEFYKTPTTYHNQRSYWCKACHAVYDRAKRLRQQYGITQADYEVLLVNQGGRCAICGTDKYLPNSDACFAVDHDHATGRVRGLLCRKCNGALGGFCDSPELLRKAISYLET